MAEVLRGMMDETGELKEAIAFGTRDAAEKISTATPAALQALIIEGLVCEQIAGLDLKALKSDIEALQRKARNRELIATQLVETLRKSRDELDTLRGLYDSLQIADEKLVKIAQEKTARNQLLEDLAETQREKITSLRENRNEIAEALVTAGKNSSRVRILVEKLNIDPDAEIHARLFPLKRLLDNPSKEAQPEAAQCPAEEIEENSDGN